MADYWFHYPQHNIYVTYWLETLKTSQTHLVECVPLRRADLQEELLDLTRIQRSTSEDNSEISFSAELANKDYPPGQSLEIFR